MKAPSRLLVEQLSAPLGLATQNPRFSWWLPDGLEHQDSYQLEIESGDSLLWSVSEDSSRSVLVPYSGPPLKSGVEYRWRVRVEYRGTWSDWAGSTFELSLLRQEDWHAAFVEPAQQPVTSDGPIRRDGEWIYPADPPPVEDRLHPVKYLRQKFSIPGPVIRARLYATAQGVYAAELNGVAVGDQVLAPGYESYDRSLSFQVYDVTALLAAGDNVLGVALGDGWYAGRIAFTGNSAQYGDRLRASWQLVVDTDSGRIEVLSDGSVVSTTEGPIRYSDLFIGELYDARRRMPGWSSRDYDDSAWTPVAIAAGMPRLHPFDGEPVRRVLALPAVEILRTPAGETVVDFGQVIAGRVRMRLVAEPGTVVTLEHSEVLDAAGNYFDNVPQPNKDQTDVYIARGDAHGEEWEPLFTFHGFRYVRLSGYPGTPAAADFVAVVLASDLEITASFECSDPSLNRLFQNVLWGQRGNFLSVPTDCPQRERAGWTGDLQVFAPTAVTNMASSAFLRRWMHNVRLDQCGDGLVPVIVPASPAMGIWESPDDPLMSVSAAAGWGDAVVIVPWVAYERYGDAGILRENYAAMSAWVERQSRVAANGLPSRLAGVLMSDQQRQRQALLWNSEPNFGDWLAPSVLASATSLNDVMEYARASGELIGALYHGRSAELLGRAAGVLGLKADEARWSEHAAQVKRAFVDEYVDDGRIMVETQGILVLTLAFEFLPESLIQPTTDRLVRLIEDADDHLDTGFLSVPYLLDVLVNAGRNDVARRLLWQRSAPSWLYAVDRGATTIWEEWTAIRPEGHVVAASFNHYAFGCVGDWMMRHIAGIQSLKPGYLRSRIAPDFSIGLESVRAHHDTPYGRLEVSWQLAGELAMIDVLVPAGTSAELRLPPGTSLVGNTELAPGKHRLTFILPDGFSTTSP